MSDQQREHLSALLDGEIDTALLEPTVSALEQNADLAAAWERYHLIGQALRGEPVRPEHRQIAALVRERIAKEPVPLVRVGRRTGGHSRLTPFLGAAVAASAAFFAVFAVPQLFDPQTGSPGSSIPVTASIPPQQFEIAGPGNRWHLDEPALQDKMDRYLVNHQAFSPSSSIKGFLPYATVVGYESGR